MSLSTYHIEILQKVFLVNSFLFGILSAWFKLISELNHKNQVELVASNPYNKWWNTIRRHSIIELPAKTIKLFLLGKNYSISVLKKFYQIIVLKDIERFKFIIGFIYVVPPTILIAVFYNPIVAYLIFCILVCLYIIIPLDYSKETWYGLEAYFAIQMALVIIVSCPGILYLTTTIPIYWSVFIMVLTLPLFMVVLVLLSSGFWELLRQALNKFLNKKWNFEIEPTSFGVGIGFSFLLSTVALLLGFVFYPESTIPQTFQLFLVNALFDGLTLFITVKLLEILFNRPKLIFPIILFDVICAAVFAFSSLYLSLIGTRFELSGLEVSRVLVGLNRTGKNIEFGAYFWIMHSTFIPTILYMSLILLSWTSKIIILPIYYFLKQAKHTEKPYSLTSALFAFIAALSFGISKFMELFNFK